MTLFREYSVCHMIYKCCLVFLRCNHQMVYMIAECDRMFISNPDGLKNGTFRSPHIVNEERHSRQCIYTFIGTENERVLISFALFDLRGSTPE